MSALRQPVENTESENGYRFLRIASERFDTALKDLTDEQWQEVRRIALLETQLEIAVLSSKEASQVAVPDSQLEEALRQVKDRFTDDEDYENILDNIKMSEEELKAALSRSLRVEAVMDLVASRETAVSETDARLFYYLHLDKFEQPERRIASHILITVNDDLEGSDEVSAKQKADAIYQRLLKHPKWFAEQALKHSECPTSLNQGLLGEISRGTLYPELEEALFAMKPHSLGQPVRSELGWHILYCADVSPAETMPLNKALPSLLDSLQSRQNRKVQRRWVAEQMKASGVAGQETR